MNDFYGEQMRSVENSQRLRSHFERIDRLVNSTNNQSMEAQKNLILNRAKSELNGNDLKLLANYIEQKASGLSEDKATILYALAADLYSPQPQQQPNYPQPSYPQPNYPQPSYQPQNNFENNDRLPQTILFSINSGRYYHNQKVFGDIDERYMLSNIPLINLGDSITLNARFGNYIKPINIEYSTSGFIIMTIEGQNITFPISSGGKQIVIGNRVPDGTRGKYIELGINISFPLQNIRRRSQY